MNNIERQEQLKEISRYYPIPKYFDLDRISWVTDDVAITSVGGAEEALLQEGYFVINVAEEILNDAHACIPIDPYVEDVERQRETVDLVSDTIQRELGHNGRKVVVHCHMGMERSVLAVAWWLLSSTSILRLLVTGPNVEGLPTLATRILRHGQKSMTL